MSSISQPFPASQFVERFAAKHLNDSQRILDIGIGTGRNSIRMAALGHTVLGLSREHSESVTALQLSERLILKGLCRFVTADAREMPLATTFDTVLINEVLHMNTRQAQASIVNRAQELTALGGHNVVSGYFVDPSKSTAQPKDYFRPGELLSHYDRPGWHIIDYVEQPTSFQVAGGQEHINSQAQIIAQKTRS